MRAILLALLLPGCAGFSGPLIDPHAKWNPQIADGRSYPCPNPLVYPYFHGWDENGEPRCTTRPMDMLYEDVDTQPEP